MLLLKQLQQPAGPPATEPKTPGNRCPWQLLPLAASALEDGTADLTLLVLIEPDQWASDELTVAEATPPAAQSVVQKTDSQQQVGPFLGIDARLLSSH
jgi:hypothetical protein